MYENSLKKQRYKLENHKDNKKQKEPKRTSPVII